MHEILTLQLGHRANYVGTHFWNTQESYFTYDSTQALSPVDHDIHFRPGIGARGEETFTPRTLIYDLKGGYGGLRKWDGLYNQHLDDGQGDGESNGVWDGNVIIRTDSQISQSDYQRSLEEGAPNPHDLRTETVRYWSDFNRVFYHPRSIVQINDYELNSTLMPFENWANGEELFVSTDRDVDILDRDVRVWAEECDQMQGMQVFTGGDDAWGGFASRYVERLRDEYGKMPIWAWGFEEEQGKGHRATQLLRTINAARTINEMATHASLYMPMSIPSRQLPRYVHVNRNSQWHVSALLSTALESVTLPSRLRPDTQRHGLLGNIEAALNVNGNQRIAQVQCTVLDPDPELSKSTSGHEMNDDRAPSNTVHAMIGEDDIEATTTCRFDMSFSVRDSGSSSIASRQGSLDHTFGAVVNLRGRIEESKEQVLDDDEINHARKRRRLGGLTVIERYHSSLEYPLLDSFPRIFSLRADVTKVAVRTSLSTTSGMSRRVKTLQKLVGRMASLDERESLSNGLGEISEAYEEGWHSRSDEDSDD